MDHLLFCANHPEKLAKRHCEKCNQDLCNECVFDSHIEHHQEIKKIEYTVENKAEEFSKIVSDDLQRIVNSTLESLKPQIYKLIQEKTKQYVNEHKNLQLKVSGISKEHTGSNLRSTGGGGVKDANMGKFGDLKKIFDKK